MGNVGGTRGSGVSISVDFIGQWIAHFCIGHIQSPEFHTASCLLGVHTTDSTDIVHLYGNAYFPDADTAHRESMSKKISNFKDEVTVVLEWSIPFFSTLKAETEPLQSKMTVVGTSAWSLILHPNDDQSKEAEATGVYVQHEFLGIHYDNRKIIAERTTWYIEPSGMLKLRTTQNYTFDKKTQGWGIPYMFHHARIWDPNPDYILVDDTFKLRVGIKFTPAKQGMIDAIRPINSLKKSPGVMFESDIGKDVVLESSEGAEFHVHWAILCANSPVFQAMFESKMKEYEEGRCVLKDTSTETLQALTHYLYLGDLDELKTTARTVLVAADMYQIVDLKEVCEHILVEELSNTNVVGHLLLADKASACILKEAALQHLSVNLRALETSGEIEKLWKEADKDLTLDIIKVVARREEKK